MAEEQKTPKVKIMNLDTEKFKFIPAKPKTKFRSLTYNLDPLIVTFPKLRIPFDSRFNTYGQSEVSLSLGETYGSKIKSESLIKKIESIDKFIEELAKSQNWLEGFPDIRYNPILKRSQNSNYAPTIKAKFAKYKGEITSTFLNESNEKILDNEADLLNKLTKGTLLLTSIEFAGLFFNEKTYGMTCKFYQSKIYPPEVEEQPEKEQMQEIEFLDSSDSDSDVECVLDEN